ncbi:glutamate-1-semialdehyde 2,1-aminomutase [Tunicatimonas pelagia]|uniref:glutamate-1-semialdehyde 2,1-aminomutase n=1 Tax=Tunicatimonas pelagia TaxID=931531 RepID=UPI002666E457|nr:glutamate-1-semialdehyde 2,1-aminomutase [Tunicatimonas pelagia]WKN43141.1 glutamate-1-semialdehyde 2,1-aminomutase [Tunicatimonas pelagia]
MQTQRSQTLFEEAQHVIPGGVNSPVRAFRAVGGNPLFIKSAEGAYIYDEDDNQYIELINSWGPMILGHRNPAVEQALAEAIPHSVSYGAPTSREVEIAQLIVSMVPSIEKVRMVNSGTEAAMSAARLARGYTGRDKFIKFEGCYHGHGDSFLIAAGSGAMTMGEPNSPGVTQGTAQDTLLATFNDLNSIDRLIASNPDNISMIMIEPVAGNMGCVLPNEGFLEGLRARCDEYGILLIFDEVMTGFRLAPGGAQELYGVTPDMSALGKIIGGGLPVGAYGGKKEVMDYVSPVGPVYQAGTLSGNPIAMAAGYAMLTQLQKHQTLYQQLTETTETIVNGIKENMKRLNVSYTINHVGSMFSLFFTEHPVYDFESASASDTKLFGAYFQEMLKRGIYLAPSQFEALFVSSAIDEAMVETIVRANYESLKAIH